MQSTNTRLGYHNHATIIPRISNISKADVRNDIDKLIIPVFTPHEYIFSHAYDSSTANYQPVKLLDYRRSTQTQEVPGEAPCRLTMSRQLSPTGGSKVACSKNQCYAKKTVQLSVPFIPRSLATWTALLPGFWLSFETITSAGCDTIAQKTPAM